MNVSCDAIVVGGGAAGLMAARELQRAGREVVLLEGSERVGGRLLTVRPLGSELPIELGAEFLHGDAPVTRSLLDELRLNIIEAEGSAVSARAGVVQPDEDRFEQLGRLLSLIDTNHPDLPFGEWLAREPGGDELGKVRPMARRLVEGFHAADADRISTHALAATDTGSLQRSARVAAGHLALAEAIAAELGDAVRLGARGQRVHWRPGRCRVEATTAAGEPLRFESRCVVIAVSMGVLQQGSLVIDPLPGPVAAALRLVAMGDVVRLPFVFRGRFWEEERVTRAAGGLPGFIHTPDSAFNVWWTQHPVSAPVLVAWSGGPAARRLLRQPMEACVRLALADLARALGLPLSDLEQAVVHAEFHDWSADPLVRGAYSYPLVDGADAWRALAEVQARTLAFAGEALASDPGTVEAALASGRRAARALLAESD